MDGEDVVQEVLFEALSKAGQRLNVFDRFAGKAADAPYFVNYGRWPWPRKLAVGTVDSEPVVILKRGADAWTPSSTIRFDVIRHRIERTSWITSTVRG